MYSYSFSVKILASNKIDVGDGALDQINKKGKDLRGNHLILFDGRKQQIIKLDASIGLKQLEKAPSPPVKTESLKKPVGRGVITYDENSGVERRGATDFTDPQKII